MRAMSGLKYSVTDPENAHLKKASYEVHKAYIKVRPGGVITCLSPSIWVYSDSTRMAGEWCMTSITYTTAGSATKWPSTKYQVGLVPFSIIKPYDEG